MFVITNEGHYNIIFVCENMNTLTYKKTPFQEFLELKLVPVDRIELSAPSLPRKCYTT